MGATSVSTFCQRCHMKCRLFCEVTDGKVARITNGMGVDCPKGIALPELLYHPNRLRHPLKRVGVRGEHQWEQVSWAEALDTMADRFGHIKKSFGPDAIATIRGSGHKRMSSFATVLFSHIIGTPNVMDVNEECNVISCLMAEVTTGDRSLTWDIGPDFRNSQCILLWGANSSIRPPHERDIRIAQAKGAKLIIVDPRPPERRGIPFGVDPAGLWLQVRPGTDAALALGLIHVVISEGLHHKDFLDRWCVGFEELKNRVREYTPEKVAEITWVPREKILHAARLFAATHPSCLHLRVGAGGGIYTNCSQTSRAITIFMALAGDIDVKGGNLLADDLGGFRDIPEEIQELPFMPGIEQKRLGAKQYPLIAGTSDTVEFIRPRRSAHNATSIQAMLDGKIKAFFVPGANPVVSLADTQLIRSALKKLEFMVTVDLFMTPTAELADLVLPAAHFLETEVPMRAYQPMGPHHNNYLLAPRKVVEPVGTCWDDRKIVLKLAERMGVDSPWKTVEEINDWQLQKLVVSYDDILARPGQMVGFPLKYRKYEGEGFKTPTGKVELRSSILDAMGYDPLPYYEEPAESPVSKPEVAKEYPFIMIDRRSIVYTNAEFQDLPSMRDALPLQQIEISSKTAADLRIKGGDDIVIERPGFKTRVAGKARLVPELHPKVISCLCLRWFPDQPAVEFRNVYYNTNAIISNAPPYDPIMGNYQVRGLLCRVRKLHDVV